ncbi:MAG: hypothetical protein O2999_08580 [Nitrospirae bacterium]|nr:hypothetical protein [Nitrospirota bacterium]MDA1304339.1 hypothetical protein [Nitrospirota bacterium]
MFGWGSDTPTVPSGGGGIPVAQQQIPSSTLNAPTTFANPNVAGLQSQRLGISNTPFVSSQSRGSGFGIRDAALFGGTLLASTIPGVGEFLDAAVLFSPGSSTFERVAAGVSLGANAVFPFLPNFGATVKVGGEAFENTFRNGRFKEITLNPGTRLDRVFEEGVNNPIGSFTTRGVTSSTLTSTEAAIRQLAITGARPNRLTSLEVTRTTRAKVGFIEGGGKNAFQIVIDPSDFGNLRELKETIKILR